MADTSPPPVRWLRFFSRFADERGPTSLPIALLRAAAANAAFGALAGLFLALLETSYVALAWRYSVLYAGDLARFAALDACLLWTIGMLGGALAGPTVALCGWVAHRQGGSRPAALRLRALGYAFLAMPVIAVASAHLATAVASESMRDVMLVATSLTVGLLIILGVAAADWLKWRSSRVGATAAVLICVATGVLGLVLDVSVLHGHYPALHLALAVGTFAVVALALRAIDATLRAERPVRRHVVPLRVAAGTLILAGAAVALIPGLGRSDTVRVLVYERSSVAPHALDLLRFAGLASTARRRAATAPSVLARAALAPGPRTAGADLILITIDSTRADHVGAYGYPRRTTPAIDGAAARGALFTHAYAPAPNTAYGMTSLMTGRHLYSLVEHRRVVGHRTLGEMLGGAGYRTVGLFPPIVLYRDRQWFTEYERRGFGFEQVLSSRTENKAENCAPAEERVDRAIDWLGHAPPGPVFLWAHFLDAHLPYRCHPEHPFGETPIDCYDSALAYTDRAVGRLLDFVAARRPRAYVVVSADHAEAFGEHGATFHDSSVYEEQLRVPLIIIGPGIPPARISAPVSTLDLVPTLLGLLGLEAPPGLFGTDLGPWLAARPPSEQLMPPVFAERAHKKLVASGSLRLVCDTAGDFCELYDLAADPAENHNVIGSRPVEAAELRGALAAWRERYRTELPATPAITHGAATAREALGALSAQLLSRDPARRLAAAQALARLPADPHARAGLRHVLAEPVTGDWAAVALARFCDADALARVERLGAAAPELAARAGLACARCGADAVALLGPGLAAPDAALRRDVVDALGEVHHPAAMPHLVRALRDPELNASARAAFARAPAVARPFLAHALEQAVDPPTRALLLRALATLPSP